MAVNGTMFEASKECEVFWVCMSRERVEREASLSCAFFMCSCLVIVVVRVSRKWRVRFVVCVVGRSESDRRVLVVVRKKGNRRRGCKCS